MMVDVIEVFDGAKNVDFMELTYCEEVKTEIPVFKIKEPSVQEWNKRARIQNTKMFIQIKKRMPKDYAEVLSWIYSSSENEEEATVLVTL